MPHIVFAVAVYLLRQIAARHDLTGFQRLMQRHDHGAMQGVPEIERDDNADRGQGCQPARWLRIEKQILYQHGTHQQNQKAKIPVGALLQ